jgi:hypothetical protein
MRNVKIVCLYVIRNLVYPDMALNYYTHTILNTLNLNSAIHNLFKGAYPISGAITLLSACSKMLKVKKGKAIPLTGHEGPYGCETSRLPHYLGNRLTYGGEVVSLTRRPPITPRKIPDTHFC